MKSIFNSLNRILRWVSISLSYKRGNAKTYPPENWNKAGCPAVAPEGAALKLNVEEGAGGAAPKLKLGVKLNEVAAGAAAAAVGLFVGGGFPEFRLEGNKVFIRH
jgi:hypothetical protein